ncbi:MAG: hypothetical protein ACJA2P_002262 [Rhodoferax sp.]|jgi:hypothetical protein
MKYAILTLMLAASGAGSCWSQTAIYRCGNEYTNTLPSTQTGGCKLMEGGYVSVVPAIRPATSAAARVVSPATASGGMQIDASVQQSRDSDARKILQFELRKAEARQAELQKEYNNGEPDKQGGEARNYQKYLDRVVELKASLTRNESDIAGIRRELGRLPSASAAK